MSRKDQTEVLVVGAGPVGMLAALLLAEEGIQVKIIDKEQRTATRSYACVLHRATLQLLDRIGLAEEICRLGRPVETVAFYDRETRRAELKFAKLSGNFPCALVLPQSDFESALEQRLLSRGTKVLWNHRLSDLQFKEGSVTASIDKLTQTAKGYIVADWDWTVQKKLETTTAFVVGADGHDSMVRDRLGIEYELLAGPEQFAVFEFETDREPGHEMRVVIDDTTTNVLWPLTGDHCRWTFQLVKTTDKGEFPSKDRESVRYLQPEVDERTRHTVERLARQRAPWFKGAVNDVDWAARIRFEHRLAKQFGKGRGWLVGDAAHQTGPVGAQSMNAGLLEAEDLAGTFKKILREHAPLRVLENYACFHRAQWEQLFGRIGALDASLAMSWNKEHAARILPCVPAFGEDFAQLIGQLGFAFETAGALA
jgi:2-polyprenyl-6-methoxyphenol hydroxylase-like FAD-dependent oxidoreductase